jgi:molybdate transport system substrate-binding protein
MLTRRGLPFLLATPALAQASPLTILGTGATETPIEKLAHVFTQHTGRAVVTATGNGGQVARRIRAGEAPDVVLNAAAALDALIHDGLARGTSRQEVGRMRLGLAVRAGMAAPDIATEAALASFLRSTSSIGISDAASGATSGLHVLGLLDRLAVPPEASGGPRRAPFARGIGAVRAVEQGEVACVITQISEIIAVPGVLLVAPLPEHLQLVTAYVAAIPARAADPAAAAQFILLATGPVGRALFREVGFAVG